MRWKLAVIGAPGALGREVLKCLAERDFPAREVLALGAGRQVGQEISYGDRTVLKVRSQDAQDYAGVQLAFLAGTPAAAATLAPKLAAAGAMTIDLTGRFALEPGVPLVVPEANAAQVAGATKRRMVASPAGASVPLAVALAPLLPLARLKRLSVATYQPVSELGKEGMDELFNQTRAIYVNDATQPEQFAKPIAFNVIPHVDRFQGDGATAAEWRIGGELRKILDPDLAVVATCVRVPVFVGLCVAAHAEFEATIEEAVLRDTLREAPGLQLVDARDDGGYVTPVDAAGEDSVFVSRLRRDPSVPHGLAFWCAVDNLRKGGALNAVQVAETLVEQGLL